MKIFTKQAKKNKKALMTRLINFSDKVNEWIHKHIGLTILSTMCWSITPFFNCITDIERGYKAFGGEDLIALIPIYAFIVQQALEDDRKEREENKKRHIATGTCKCAEQKNSTTVYHKRNIK